MKKNKGVGRKKIKLNIKYDELNNYSKEFVIEILKIFTESTNNEIDLDEAISKIKKLNSYVSLNKILYLLGISRTSYFRWKKQINLPKPEAKNTSDEELVIKSFKENKGLYGRVRLSIYIYKKYKINLNYRKIGRIMNKFSLKCLVRQKKRKKEKKDTNVKFIDLVQRDYNGEKNNIVSTDVSYITAPKDSESNHLYLSVAIHHKTKAVVSWNLSETNDTKLVIEHISKIHFKDKWILHSDHGYQYSSKEYIKLTQKLNAQISMSRIGNSLDNRESEYFFSVIKSECLNLYNLNKLTFNEIYQLIDEYINFYNKIRFQSVLNWKTPQQCWREFNF
ncbi:IS3 family transposase [Mycoplasma sp. 6243]|uniref:IS3 family transposase n=3 Tax=Mycoplasma sp. 6243 TaxID=3440865 RepID=UPI003EB73289